MSEASDADVVAGFGDEWSRFDQAVRTEADLRQSFDRYFAVFPWDRLPAEPRGFDLGCGSGRWARFVAERCGSLTCIDPAQKALDVAQRNLADHPNVDFLHAAAGALPLAGEEYDFGYSLGVLHHTPDPSLGLRDAVRILRPGAPFLVYVYYALDNRPVWFRAIWRVTNGVRTLVSRLPHPLRYGTSQVIAVGVYWPLSRLARLAERLGRNPDRIPLSGYRDKPFYVLRTDALDRFGTRIEHRFTREGVVEWMEAAGLERITVSDGEPYWCAVGFKPATTSA